MGEIIFLKLLPITVSVAIVACHLTEGTQVNVQKKENSKNFLKVKEIENWLTKVNEEEVALMKPEPPDDDIEHMPANPSPVDEDAIAMDDDMDMYDNISYADYPDGEISFNFEDLIYESSFTRWHVNVTHQAAQLLKENKDILETHNKTAFRLLHLYSIAGALFYSEPKKRKELKKAEEGMLKNFLEAIKSESKVCPQRPRLYKLDLKPQDCSVLKCLWESWHNEVGMAVRENFERMVELSNEAAKENGYNDAGEVWKIADVEDTNAEQEMKRLLDGVMPLYEQLHAYVRRKVIKYYSNYDACDYQPGPEDPIPAHLTGNLIGQEWTELESLVLPYPEATLPNFTELMNLSNLDQNDMACEAEKFFTSLGFRPMTEKFWQKSIFNATDDNELGCHPRAIDNLDGCDYEIFMCGSLTLKDFGVLHHEMGHIVAYMESEQLPYKFSHEVNRIFGEGLGDSLALSISTPDHLEKIFNIHKDDRSVEPGDGDMTLLKKRDINTLMRSALYILPLLPYSYVLEMWRYQVFSGNITPEEYNRSWWKMRARYQGIAPPSKRPKLHFDPGAILHVAYNAPYGKYFFSLFVAFQMHEALCKLSKHEGPLHHCDIYQSEDAGSKLREILKQGGSKTTVELLNELTGDKGYRFEPILEYYKPLHDWLKEQNKGHTVKWKGNFCNDYFDRKSGIGKEFKKF